ncbi:MAG: hypothetical protein NXI32_25315 [bacterium]|nr:hypothetical protein [bacterium]
MPGDLERFLQQAAERLAEKVRQSEQASAAPPPRRDAPKNIRQAERAGLEDLEPTAVDAVIVEPKSAQDTNPLSQLDTRHLERKVRPELAVEISLADEKMASHVQHVTSGDVVHLRDASSALQADRSLDGRTQVRRRNLQVSPLVEMLRKPESLRAAFIASQIFDRPDF